MAQSKSEVKQGVAPLIIAATFVVVVWGSSGFLLAGDDQRGTFGDMFGAVNALFSGLAFASLIYTIYLQRIELSLQRSELFLTREELAGQKEQMAAQTQILVKQNFESNFFQLLRLLQELVQNLDLQDREGRITRGRDCFVVFAKRMRFDVEKRIGNANPSFESVLAVYESFHASTLTELGHYYKVLYNIVKFIDSSDIPDKRFYTNILRAQLSYQELELLCFNGLSTHGKDKFKPLIEKYGLLKGAPINMEIKEFNPRKFYEPGAFC